MSDRDPYDDDFGPDEPLEDVLHAYEQGFPLVTVGASVTPLSSGFVMNDTRGALKNVSSAVRRGGSPAINVRSANRSAAGRSDRQPATW